MTNNRTTNFQIDVQGKTPTKEKKQWKYIKKTQSL